MDLVHKRQAEPSLDDSLFERIEIEFAIPVYLTKEQQRLLHELILGVVSNPANVPLDGVHLLNAHGPKPLFSLEDVEVTGESSKLVAGSEKLWDETTLYFGSSVK